MDAKGEAIVTALRKRWEGIAPDGYQARIEDGDIVVYGYAARRDAARMQVAIECAAHDVQELLRLVAELAAHS